jgi:prepilin-type N-terminal cleavage/methylation domain-containing protein
MKNLKFQRMIGRRGKKQQGFTLTELLVAAAVLLVGIVAVAQLVPASISSNAAARNDSTALVFAQRELTQMMDQPLNPAVNPPSFTDAHGFSCNLGDPTTPNQVVGSSIVVNNNQPAIDFTAAQVAGYGFNYRDPNDPYGTTYDVRWAVITTVNSGMVTAKRFILGTMKRGGNGFSKPVTLDTMVEK